VSSEVELKTKLLNLPDNPGCYLFKDKTDQIIYIGKASSLKKRVKSYFQKTAHDPKTEKLISHITDVDFIITNSEREALILESNLVKEHKPKYNIDLRDDKRYPFVKITVNEAFPRVLVVRRVTNDKAKYFGPYTSATSMRRTLKLLRKIFPIRSCSLELPSKRKYRVCLDYFIGHCGGCCEDLVTSENYKMMIDEVILFLSGRSTEIVTRLKIRMENLSEDLKYEEAAKVRDQLKAINSVIQKQKVVYHESVFHDIIAVSIEGDDAGVALLQVREGVLIGRKDFIVSTAGFDIPDIIRNFLPRYYRTISAFPDDILISAKINDLELVKSYLEELSSQRVNISVPKRGTKAALIRMAETNAKHHLQMYLAQKSVARKKAPHVVYSLSRDFYLKKLPRSIAACDISNLGTSEAVGSIVYFYDGRPKKSEYRRMKIKTVVGQDDFSMMKEIVGRYFNHLAENDKENPDLLLIDGGKGQLNAAISALSELNVTDQQTVSLAKRFEEVFLPGRSQPISLPKVSSSIKLLTRIRDEAHRFAVTYHRTLRSKKIKHSELDGIPGVGNKRKIDLIAVFGSVERIKKASLDQLKNTPKLPEKVAVTVWEYFRKQESDEG